jgi:NADH-quinone oxidoreductase subunit D
MTFEGPRTDIGSWEIGPYHGALPGPMKLGLKLDGELIVSSTVETGFLHRGLEKAFELKSWQASVAFADHLDPEGAVFGELALCLAVEEIASLEVPLRAQRIRVLLSELSRISGHMGYIVKAARAVGAETMVHYVLRDRERVLDLFELLTGARFSLNFLRFGGVKCDVTEGFVERVMEVCDLIRIRNKEYNDLFTFNHSFLRRTAGVGVLPIETVHRLGVTGPNARASGETLDMRKEHPYCGYDKLDFSVPVGRGEGGTVGDAHDRFLIRLREITQSLEILKQATEAMPPGEYSSSRAVPELAIPAGEAQSRIESSRGMLTCHVVSDGKQRPSRVQFRAPTSPMLEAIPELVQGVRVEDLPIVLASLDLGIAEADR